MLDPGDRQRQAVGPCPGKTVLGELHPPSYPGAKGERKLELSQKSRMLEGGGLLNLEKEKSYRPKNILKYKKGFQVEGAHALNGG